MMEKFYCSKCEKIFEKEGEKKEWQSSIFGKCWKLIAFCPDCHSECSEWRAKFSFRKNSCSQNCSSCSRCN